MRLLAVAADVQKAHGLRGAEPFVAIAGVIGRPQTIHVERDHGRPVGAVDQRIDAAAVQLAHDFLDGKDQGRRAGDVIEHGEPRPRRYPLQNRVDHLPRRVDRQRQVGLDHDRARSLGDVANDVAAGVVIVGGDEDFVAGPEIRAIASRY